MTTLALSYQRFIQLLRAGPQSCLEGNHPSSLKAILPTDPPFAQQTHGDPVLFEAWRGCGGWGRVSSPAGQSPRPHSYVSRVLSRQTSISSSPCRLPSQATFFPFFMQEIYAEYLLCARNNCSELGYSTAVHKIDKQPVLSGANTWGAGRGREQKI